MDKVIDLIKKGFTDPQPFYGGLLSRKFLG
jgi:hypothetical protein